jgi:tetratricopeptide (TPR) repeat protein
MYLGLGMAYRLDGRWDDAIANLRKVLDLSPDRLSAHFYLGLALMQKGDPRAALEATQKESFEALRLIGLAMVYHDLGRNAESDAALDALINNFGKDAAYNIAYVWAYRGEADRAFEWLEKALEYKDPGLTDVQTDQLFANIHDDPRWLPFLERIGRSPEQLAAIELEVELPR